MNKLGLRFGWWIVKRLEDMELWLFDFRKTANGKYIHKSRPSMNMNRAFAVRWVERIIRKG